MDSFGIGAAMLGMARVYGTTARRSGRTTAFIAGLKQGGRVIVASVAEARDLMRLCRERGVEVQVHVVSPQCPTDVFGVGTPKGRTLFDHGWLESFYLWRLQQAVDEVDQLQRESSGAGEPHLATRMAAQEIAKWQF